jgi:hypothetical protein
MPVETAKEFEIWTSERSYRYKEEAILNHAPQTPGIYHFATFDAQQNGKVVYMNLVRDTTIYKALYEHLEGGREPKVQELLSKYPNLYFGFVVQSNAVTPEDQQDLFWAMAQQEKPELNDLAQIQPTGRYAQVTVKDKSIL